MTNYFITGTTRGIGKSLVANLLQRPNTTLVASVRDLSASAATSLEDLPKASGSKLILVKIDATSETDAQAAVDEIQTKHGITSLDVVIANAGAGPMEAFTPVKDTTTKWLRELFEVNTVSVITLFKAVLPLLEKGDNARFVVSTSAIGSNGVAQGLPVGTSAYGVSKAAVNWFLSKAHAEHANIAFIPIHPGLVDTDMGTPFYEATGGVVPIITVEESVKGYLNVVDGATRESASGKYVQYDGEALPF